MAYCILNSGCCLRGWLGRPFMLIKPGKTVILKKNEFDALILCDGQTDLDMLDADDEIFKTLRLYEEKGFVSFSEKPQTLEHDQLYRRYNTRYMSSFHWSITGRCNFRCRHCYLDAPGALMGELSREEAFSVIDQMAECGARRIELTGGEPFVRADFWDLVDRIREKGMDISMIYTNGWLLTEKVLDNFAARDMKPEFSISFDGLGWHDWMRGVKGAEEAALRALRLCQMKDFPTNVEICLHKGNLCTFRDTVLALAETGTRSIKCASVMTTDLWTANSEGNNLSDAEYFDAMLDYIPHYFEDGMPIDLLIGGVVDLHRNSTNYWAVAEFDKGTEECLNRHVCGAVRTSCYIAPDGRLLPCMPIASMPDQSIFPKIQDIGLAKALRDSFYMHYIDLRVKDLRDACKTCRECPYLLKCGGGCRACAAVAGEKDLMGPDPTRCLMWKGGYVDRVHEVCDAAIAKYCKSGEQS